MAKARVYVTRLLPAAGMDRILAETEAVVWEGEMPPPKEEILRQVASCEGLVCLLTDPIDAEVMDAAPHLKVIAQMAVGYDNIDIPAATERGIPVGNTPGVLTETTADMAWTLLMATARRVGDGQQYVRDGKWQTWGPMTLLGPDLYGATLGIVGMGRIGVAVARRAQGFNMRILYTNLFPVPEADLLGASQVEMDTLLAESDFISLHCALTPETTHLIGAAELRKMKPGALLINTSRGPVVDQDALTEALQAGVIAGAGLDVTDPEPIDPNHPLVHMENVIVLPHIASASIGTRNKMAELTADNLLAGLRGERLPNPVNPEVYERG
ncbi:MAG: D-glycerate dehydrogenase [Ardenticatenales bacterium]|nr:D-glycerate dehydrogenase [Ardenticatenales bacterium]